MVPRRHTSLFGRDEGRASKTKYDPLKSMLGDVLGIMQGGKSGGTLSTVKLDMPSIWSDIERSLHNSQTASERSFRDDVVAGRVSR